MFDIGGPELLLILFIALLVLGPRRLPEMGRRLGEAMGYLRRATRDMRRTLEREVAVDEVRQETAGLREAQKGIRREIDELRDSVARDIPASPAELEGAPAAPPGPPAPAAPAAPPTEAPAESESEKNAREKSEESPAG
jgi:sec-independent protein translocase protein TatB